MDNFSAQQKPQLFKIIKKAEVNFIFSPYSPDLNPIEYFWSWLKRQLKNFLPKSSSFDNALSACFQLL